MVNSRTRGHNLERDAAAEWKDIGFNAMTTRQGNRELDSLGVDVFQCDPFFIQCKMGRNYHNPKKIEEINRKGLQEYHNVDTVIPVLQTRADRKKSITCLYSEDFNKLLSFAKNQSEIHGISLEEIFR